VVAVRLSVWLAEVDLLITVKLEQYKGMVSGSIPKEFWSPLPLKLNVSGGIEAVMSELHYLRKGASDVAQLEYFAREFDTYIDKAAGN